MVVTGGFFSLYFSLFSTLCLHYFCLPFSCMKRGIKSSTDHQFLTYNDKIKHALKTTSCFLKFVSKPGHLDGRLFIVLTLFYVKIRMQRNVSGLDCGVPPQTPCGCPAIHPGCMYLYYLLKYTKFWIWKVMWP